MAVKKFAISVLFFILGFTLVYVALQYAFHATSRPADLVRQGAETVGLKRPEIVGFLPYWLLGHADKDYAPYLTTLTYFGLTVAPDGTIQKLAAPGQEEPGWYDLHSGKIDSFFTQARNNDLKLSLLVFSGDQDAIMKMLDNPASSAAVLVSEAAPIMKQYHFTDLNLDIESVEDATPEARAKFTAFVREVKNQMTPLSLGTLTLDSSPTDLVKDRLINLADVGPFVDKVVLMTYDYHYQGSFVTGPVGPIGGAGKDAEFDSETAVQKALEVLPKDKILLGVPLYGYEWETLTDFPRSAVMPGSGQVASNRRMEKFLADCATCSAKLDTEAQEKYLIYKDADTGTFHQIFFPDQNATAQKIQLAQKYDLSGVALWALGYDGDTILDPLRNYKHTLK